MSVKWRVLNFIKHRSEGGQKIAQRVKYLPCKRAEMSSDPQHPRKEQVVWKSSTGEAETGGSLELARQTA